MIPGSASCSGHAKHHPSAKFNIPRGPVMCIRKINRTRTPTPSEESICPPACISDYPWPAINNLILQLSSSPWCVWLFINKHRIARSQCACFPLGLQKAKGGQKQMFVIAWSFVYIGDGLILNKKKSCWLVDLIAFVRFDWSAAHPVYLVALIWPSWLTGR